MFYFRRWSWFAYYKTEKLFENVKAGDELGNGDHETTTPTIPTEGRNKCSRLKVANLKKSKASWEAKRVQESYKYGWWNKDAKVNYYLTKQSWDIK